jgi:hypothetical protein
MPLGSRDLQRLRRLCTQIQAKFSVFHREITFLSD